ncbi:MAG: nitroreductase family protein [Lentisphaeria bacterium]|nr:nitroreductase family protein [Lentisphaeria bacterium]
MNIFKSRRSIRKFTAEPIPQEVMTSILEDAMSGPSAMRRDPWEFIVINDKKMLADVSSFLPHGGLLQDAACGVVVCGDIKNAHDNSESYMLQDVSAAIENLLLSAESRNIGSCWLGVHPRRDRIEGISRYFSLPENIIPVAVIALGFKAETKAPETRFNINKIHYNGF